MVVKKWNVIRQTICWSHSKLINQVNSNLITALWATMCFIHSQLRVKEKHLCTGGKSSSAYLFFFKSKKYHPAPIKQPVRLISLAAASIWVVLVVVLFLVCLPQCFFFFLMAAVATCFCHGWKDADWSRLMDKMDRKYFLLELDKMDVQDLRLENLSDPAAFRKGSPKKEAEGVL